MDETTRGLLNDLLSGDREAHNRAHPIMLPAVEQPVDWSYEAWDEVVAALRHPDNQVRSIASQMLCGLAKSSDPDGRILRDFDALLSVTRDERFVTARHCLQSMWKIGLAGEPQRERVVEGLARRFAEAGGEKNGTLVRYDIAVGLRQLYDQTQDESIRETALALIETETDPKYRKKYAGGVEVGGRFYCMVDFVDHAVETVTTRRGMCRNIRPLFNFEPPANQEEVRAAALQYVRKVSGFTRPAPANQAAFDAAVDAVAAATQALLAALETKAPPKDRAEEAEKARARSAKRFG